VQILAIAELWLWFAPCSASQIRALRIHRDLFSVALGLLLPLARGEGLPYVELTTDVDNLASQRVITHNGGVRLEQFNKSAAFGGTAALRFRIRLT
jgi:predicted acetyltransferase